MSTFAAEAVTIVDAAHAAHRDALLAGRLNTTECPACGLGFGLEAPLLYYDLEREVALALVPDGMTAGREQHERIVGRLANRVIDALPPDRRKMYLLQPRTFWTSQTFMEAVLEANGVSAEDLERARATAELVEELAAAESLEAVRVRLEEVGRADDRSLPRIAEAMADEALQRGDDTRAARMTELRERLAAIVGLTAPSVETLIDVLTQAHAAGELDGAVSAVRPALDYAFFSELTRRIDAADAERAPVLIRLRSELLEAIDAHDAVVTAQIERAGDTLRAVLGAQDPVESVRRRARALDSAFFSVLQANLEAAGAAGNHEHRQSLERVRDAALGAVEEAMSPRQRLVNQLARAGDAAERSRCLDAAAEVLDRTTLDAVRSASAEARAVGALEVANRLRAAADEVAARMGSATGPPQ